MSSIRAAAVDGLFYPARPDALRAEVLQRLDAAAASPRPSAKLLIAPHAGYAYCGPVAARAYAEWRGLPGIDRVVVLGPAHRIPLDGLAAPGCDAFETPLGPIELDRDAIAALGARVRTIPRAHEREHAIEVQLPFLQLLFGSRWRLVPLVVGEASADEVAEVLELLWGGAETRIVISSDLSHYLSHAQARVLDAATASRIVARDATLGGQDACGACAINGALRLARRRELAVRQLALCTSGDTGGEPDRVVGYGAFAIDEEPSA